MLADAKHLGFSARGVLARGQTKLDRLGFAECLEAADGMAKRGKRRIVGITEWFVPLLQYGLLRLNYIALRYIGRRVSDKNIQVSCRSHPRALSKAINSETIASTAA